MHFGVRCFSTLQVGTWWIVTLPCDEQSHSSVICKWCEQQFGYVDMGSVFSGSSQDFWFTSEEHALACWLTWS